MKRPVGLQPRWPDRLASMAISRRRGGRRPRNLRRALAAALFIAAGVIAVTGRAGPLPGVAVIAVARDLPAGTELVNSDLVSVNVTSPPSGAVRQLGAGVGRLLAGPVRRGEVLTDVRLVSDQGPDPGPGRVAVPVPVDPATVELLRPGAHVAVLAVTEAGAVTVLATESVVLTIPPPSKAQPAKRLVVLGVPIAAADRITALAVTGRLALRFT